MRWGAPKTVKQLIGQLQTLDPDLETTALLRMPADFRDGNAVRQVPLSISYERMDGQWLAPYKSDHRKVLAFWAKPDDRNTAERGEELYTTPPAPVVPEEMPKGLAGQIVSLLAHNIGDKFLAQKIWNACRTAMHLGAENTESRCTMQPLSALDSLPLNADSRCSNSPVFRDGWVMVPAEPTEEMLAELCLVKGWTDRALNARYQAMLAAAPKPEA